ncbi:CDP-glycerol glycerophosphotransferase family protein [Bacillus niameyensis]|uniref:CDP-glycerol glycerophosphotransferase family protein n=1 Tax=Bacillus niameyensis TaxID=1522308 RepID=UPI0007828509|nr:CDP-glycerol glycerophosphotransferase family protein [Bacillus niameyensis]
MSFLKLMPTVIVKYMLKTFHGLFCLFYKINPEKVTFASYRSNKLQDNLAFVHKEMLEKYPQYKPYYLFKKFDSSLKGKVSYIFHMIHACYQIATSRYFIIDDFYFPIYVIKPRKGVEIVQLWHSAGAFKKFGLSTVDKPFGPSRDYLKHVAIHGNYSKAYVSSSEVIPFFAEAFNMPEEKIYPLGVPRTDYFYSKDVIANLRADFFAAFPELKGKKILLYAPTFRGKSHYQDEFELPFDVNKMAEQLGENYALLIHLHPYMQATDLKLGANRFAVHIKDAFVIEELLAVSDLLITDYSTVFFDYSLLGRPIIFYPYDLEDYIRSRDFYYSYEDLIPGPMVTDTDSLIHLIKERAYSTKEVSEFRERFFDHHDGRAAERIAHHIFGGTADQTKGKKL